MHNRMSRVATISIFGFFFFSSRRRHTRFDCDWSSDVCSSDLSSLLPLSGACYNCRVRVGAERAAFWEQCPQQHHFRSEEHTSELQSQSNLVCRLLLEKKKTISTRRTSIIVEC